MNSSPELSVYSEAKSEYTRQLCGFLTPSLETYFLQLLETAKQQSPSPQKALWQFQNLLQAIPDWNQDKVIRETDVIQADTKCDYLEELLTAVFLAHAKVLSAIRLNTKQNKLQITIPKLDHFLHRVLSESARSLRTNAFLFAETSSFEKQLEEQKPVEEEQKEEEKPVEEEKKEEEKPVEEEQKEEEKPVVEEKTVEEESKPVEEQESKPAEEESKPVVDEITVEEKPVIEETSKPSEEPVIHVDTTEEAKPESQTIYIDTKPSVSFQQSHTFFSSDNLESNTIEEAPFAEAELKPDEDEEEEDWEELEGDMEDTADDIEAEELNL